MSADNSYKKDFLNTMLKKHPTSKISDKGYLNCPCPVCDKNENRSKDHLYILINDNAPLAYWCFRATCGIKGVVNKSLAKKLGITDEDLLDKIGGESSKKGSRKYKVSYFTNGKLKIPSDVSNEAKDYFYKRTGVDLTNEVSNKFHIFSNLKLFYKLNKEYIDNTNIKKYIYHHKDKDYIYFLNETCTSVTYRRIDDNGDYSKGKINLVSPENIFIKHKPYSFTIEEGKDYNKKGETLFIAEGIFDILNVYFIANKKNIKGTYITSGGNAGMVSIIREFSKFNRNANIIIFADNDVPLSFYKKRLSKLTNRLNEITVYYNEASKDIGDISKPIKLKKYIIYKKKGR